ncbi:hypothetical protein E2C01_027738 [Portunus trituberculatus]|uniref:Uncharacterized protein n=1 Tax=Portunus trituberculatus TaxID=210409 RepID=A0A5B7EMZ7_PORTR|nr:hypothetical protein [Portunus trituberculatus]
MKALVSWWRCLMVLVVVVVLVVVKVQGSLHSVLKTYIESQATDEGSARRREVSRSPKQVLEGRKETDVGFRTQRRKLLGNQVENEMKGQEILVEDWKTTGHGQNKMEGSSNITHIIYISLAGDGGNTDSFTVLGKVSSEQCLPPIAPQQMGRALHITRRLTRLRREQRRSPDCLGFYYNGLFENYRSTFSLKYFETPLILVSCYSSVVDVPRSLVFAPSKAALEFATVHSWRHTNELAVEMWRIPPRSLLEEVTLDNVAGFEVMLKLFIYSVSSLFFM